MKKTVVLIAALLSCCLAYSQEANLESSGNSGELTIVPRLDLDGDFAIQDEPSFGFGSSSLYTLFEGDFADHFSFSVCNHWLSSDPVGLYRNTFHTDECNWLDWATITGQFGNFFITAGKDIMAVATFEIDAFDYDSHSQLNSAFWNSLQTYQWGGRAGWTSDDENSRVGFQFTTSPFGEKINSGLFNYTVFGSHDFENASLMASVSFMPEYDDTVKDDLLRVYALGGKYRFPDVTLGADVFYLSSHHFGTVLSCEADFNERLGILGKVGYEKIQCPNRFFGGASLYCYPLKNSRDLRIHGMVACQTGLLSDCPQDKGTCVSVSIGATYYFNITVF